MTAFMGPINDDDWETVYDRRISLLKEAARSGNTAILAALQVQDGLEHGDLNEAIQDEDPDTKKTRYEMAVHLQGENKKTKQNAANVKSKMEELKDEDKDEDDWERMLDETIDKGKQDSDARWEALRKFGKEKIKKLKSKYQGPVARLYAAALKGVSGFIGKCIDWLTGALNTIGQWLGKAWAKIKEWANQVSDWFITAVDIVATILGGPRVVDDSIMRAGQALKGPAIIGDLSKDSVGAHGLGDIVKKLHGLNLDNAVLVKKSGGWIVELPI
jgi:hypothetical protein